MSVTAVPIRPTPTRVVFYVWLGVALAVAFALLLAVHGTGQVVALKGTAEQFLDWNGHQAGVQETASGLQYKVIKAGEPGPHPTNTDVALVNYRGTLRDGTEFDASRQPTPMPVAGLVKGFSEGLKLMTRGATYRFWIKPDLAYGEHSPDPTKIPNGSLLIFDVQLLGAIPQEQYQQLMMQQMMQQQQQQQQQRGGAPGGPPPGGAPGGLPPGAAPQP